MTYFIDKSTAYDVMKHLNETNLAFVHELPADKMTSLDTFAYAFCSNFLKELRLRAQTEDEQWVVLDSATHGVHHAVQQTLLFATPPSAERLPDAPNLNS